MQSSYEKRKKNTNVPMKKRKFILRFSAFTWYTKGEIFRQNGEDCMERDIMKQLVEWKDATDRKPLLLTGVRQCGKTYVCKEFGAQYFEDVAYFYFEGNKGLISAFEYDFDVNRIVDEL